MTDENEQGQVTPEEEPSGGELVARESYTPSRIEGGMAHFEEYMMLADRISRTAMVPSALRGKPDEVLAVVMYGAELGIGPMQALQQVNFIEGKPAMAPELMRALIREAGHRLNIKQSATECVIQGERGDTGEVGEASFTIEDAVDAELCRIDAEGHVVARSRDGKKLPWEKYTKDMLLARATSRIARMMFSDVIAGMSYTPEEVLSFVEPSEPKRSSGRGSRQPSSNSSGGTRRRGAPNTGIPATDEDVEKLRTAISMLDPQDAETLKKQWQSAEIPPLKNGLTVVECQKALSLVDALLNAVSGGDGADEDENGAEDDLGGNGPIVDAEVLDTKPASGKGPALITPPEPAHKIGPRQIGTIHARAKDLGIDEFDLHDYVADILDVEAVSSLSNLTKSQAHKVIDTMMARLDETK